MIFSGVLPVDKTAGCTSARVVAMARKLFNGIKAGHAGTLDPAATGVLPVLLGEATAFARFLPEPKTYLAEVCFGAETDTGDAAGEVLRRRTPPSGLADAVRAVLPEFTGFLPQTAPAYSALKHAGKPMYYYARNKIAAPEKRRAVRAYALRLRAAEETRAFLEVRCGGGFYVRALARDLGAALGCGAHLASLRRTRCASFCETESVNLETLAALPPDLRLRYVAPPERALPHLPSVRIDAARARALGLGQIAAADGGAPVRFWAEGRFAGVGRRCGNNIWAEKMLSWTRETREMRV